MKNKVTSFSAEQKAAFDILKKAKATLKISKDHEGEHFILPYNRSFSLMPGDLKVYYSDFIERPGYYVKRDLRLSKHCGITIEDATKLSALRLREIENFYNQQNGDTKSESQVPGAGQGDNNGKGSES